MRSLLCEGVMIWIPLDLGDDMDTIGFVSWRALK